MLESLATRQDAVIRLSLPLTLISLVALISLCGNVWLWSAREVHYVVAGTSGASQAGMLTDTFVYAYVTDTVHERYTWSYVDIAAAQDTFKARLHPRLLQDFEKTVAPEERKLVKADQVTSGIVPLDVQIIERAGHVRRVRVTAVRHLWIGGTLRLDDVTIMLIVAPLVEQGWPKDLRVWSLTDDLPLPTRKR